MSESRWSDEASVLVSAVRGALPHSARSIRRPARSWTMRRWRSTWSHGVRTLNWPSTRLAGAVSRAARRCARRGCGRRRRPATSIRRRSTDGGSATRALQRPGRRAEAMRRAINSSNSPAANSSVSSVIRRSANCRMSPRDVGRLGRRTSPAASEAASDRRCRARRATARAPRRRTAADDASPEATHVGDELDVVGVENRGEHRRANGSSDPGSRRCSRIAPISSNRRRSAARRARPRLPPSR